MGIALMAVLWAGLFSISFSRSLEKDFTSRLNIKMDRLEEKMNQNNKKYQLEMEKKEELEERLNEIKKEKVHLEGQMDISRKELISLVEAGLISSVGQGESQTEVILDQAIRKKMEMMKKDLDELKKLTERYLDMEELLFSRLRSAGYLADTLFELEQRRSDLLGKKRSIAKKREKARKDRMKFTSPMKSYEGLHYSDKGITYRFGKKEKVMATKKGKVVHSGSLAPYGNIVMLDHSGGVHSVILGDFLPTVKKGVFVKREDLLGETAGHPGLVYFEVRKNNNIQNTALLMDQRFLVKSRRL